MTDEVMTDGVRIEFKGSVVVPQMYAKTEEKAQELIKIVLQSSLLPYDAYWRDLDTNKENQCQCMVWVGKDETN